MSWSRTWTRGVRVVRPTIALPGFLVLLLLLVLLRGLVRWLLLVRRAMWLRRRVDGSGLLNLRFVRDGGLGRRSLLLLVFLISASASAQTSQKSSEQVRNDTHDESCVQSAQRNRK